MRRATAAAVLLAICLALPAANTPVARQRPDGMLTLSLPVELLNRREVRRQLTSGLTTTFIAMVERGNQRGGARIAVRYELWDEIYIVTTRSIDRTTQTLRFATIERLTEWWAHAALPVLPRAAGVSSVQMTLEVLPFSVEEQRETQQWLSRSLGESSVDRADADADAGETGGGAALDNSVLDIIIGTSIQRRPIVRYRQTVAVQR